MLERNLFLVHWNSLEAKEFAEPICEHGCRVRIESEDGSRAFREIKECRPDAVLIFLSRLPSHGRMTAQALAGDAATRDIPIVFIGGRDWTVEQTRAEFPGATFVGPEDICAAVKPLLEGPHEPNA